jgi:type II secretory pathway pseudopilin PulG
MNKSKREEKMKGKTSTRNFPSFAFSSRGGFTVIEVLVGSSIMLAIIVATLSLYTRSNKVSVDQQQFAEIQHDVRAAMYFVSRDIRSAGAGLLTDLIGYSLEGIDGHGPSPESPDSIKLMGNFYDPLDLTVQFQAGVIFQVEVSDLNNGPYQEAFYEGKEVMITSPTCPGCFALLYISNISWPMGAAPGTFTMPPGQSELNPPGGLSDTGCPADCWAGAKITFIQIKQYWLDTTGNPGDYPDLNPSIGQDGYLGIPYTLYLTTIDEGGDISHMPLALNIESLQFQYFGDLDNDGILDGPTDWDNSNWTIDPMDDEATKQAKLVLISRIRMVQIWVLGRTRNPYVSVSGTPSANLHLYRRPAVANSAVGEETDKHRRFLLESTAQIRNMSLSIYNSGTN